MSVTLNIIVHCLNPPLSARVSGANGNRAFDDLRLLISGVDDPDVLYLTLGENLTGEVCAAYPLEVAFASVGEPACKDERIVLVCERMSCFGGNSASWSPVTTPDGLADDEDAGLAASASSESAGAIPAASGQAALATPEALVGGPAEFPYVFNAMQEVFLRFGKWQRDMDRSLLREEGLQSLLDIAEPMVENHVDIVDPAMKLLAHTSMDFDDPITNRLVQLGYHPEETLEQFMLDHRFRLWAETDGFIVNTQHKISRFSSILYTFKAGGSFSVIVVVICNRIEPCGYVFDVLRYFIERVRHYVGKHFLQIHPTSNAIDAFLHDLFYDKAGTLEQVQERSRFVGLEYERPYCVFYFGLESPADIAIAEYANAIAQAAIPCISVTDDGAEVVVCSACRHLLHGSMCYPQSCPPHTARMLSSFESILASRGRWCARSSVMENLSQIPAAFWQARRVYELHRQMGNARVITSGKGESRIMLFDDCHLYLELLESTRLNNLIYGTSQLKAIWRMRSYDQQNATDYYRFLRCYLENERRISLVAKLQSMHRNNVGNRLCRIKELFGIECDTATARLNLLNAYKLLDLYGA